MRHAHFNDVWVEQLTTRMVLPEGAKHIKATVGDAVHYSRQLFDVMSHAVYQLQRRVGGAAHNTRGAARGRQAHQGHGEWCSKQLFDVVSHTACIV
jgi:hypothetical protein